MDVCSTSPVVESAQSNTVADDLGVIAEVIICDSFKDKFAPNDTEKSVARSQATNEHV
jgi:hypothetical protein